MTKELSFKEAQDQYREWAEHYDFDASKWKYSTPKKIAKRLVKYLKPKMEIIDLGCGTGLNGLEYSSLDLEFTGIDSSIEMLKKAKERGYNIVQGSIVKTNFMGNQFDVSICTAVLEYFSDIRPCIKEMKRIVKPSGIITFTVPCSQIKGLYKTSKKKLENILERSHLKPLEIFKILSHKEEGIIPIYFWVSITSNSK